MLFLGEERMMAMLDLGGTPSLEPPTRFQECVIFHFLLTGNRPKRAAPRTERTGEGEGRGRRASLSGGAALKEFRDSCALWRPLHHSSLSSSLRTPPNDV